MNIRYVKEKLLLDEKHDGEVNDHVSEILVEPLEQAAHRSIADSQSNDRAKLLRGAPFSWNTVKGVRWYFSISLVR
jgi:hypothetical protein